MPVGSASRLSYGVGLLAAAWVGGYWLLWPSGAGTVDPEIRVAITSPSRPEDAAIHALRIPEDRAEREPAGGREGHSPSREVERPVGTGVPSDSQDEPETPRSLTHTVVRDDTLEGLSKQYYGTIRHARLIFEANRDQLASMDRLTLGQVLRIPPRPEG